MLLAEKKELMPTACVKTERNCMVLIPVQYFKWFARVQACVSGFSQAPVHAEIFVLLLSSSRIWLLACSVVLISAFPFSCPIYFTVHQISVHTDKIPCWQSVQERGNNLKFNLINKRLEWKTLAILYCHFRLMFDFTTHKAVVSVHVMKAR
jgi:hypothetical protein